MQKLDSKDHRKVVRKLEEFMKHCQILSAYDSYLIVNRNSPALSEAAEQAAKNLGLNVIKFDLAANHPYKHFPSKLKKLLLQNTPKAGVGLFDYSSNSAWNIREVGARIELLHHIIEEVPISWAHSPGITLDMAVNGPIQCNYKKMAEDIRKASSKTAKQSRKSV